MKKIHDEPTEEDSMNIDGNCISVISEYIPDYIPFGLVSMQFRDSWIGEKKSSINLFKKYVKDGNLDMVKYHIKNGCPFDDYTCISAARHGHLEILKLLISEGCELNDEICRFAAYNGCLLYTSPSPRDGLLSRMPSSA